MERRRWKVETIEHRETGLYVAVSDDLPGLYVHGRSERELEERVPVAIKALLEAAGDNVGEIVKCDDDEKPESFRVPVAVYAQEKCHA
jgi:predicted RNase H-like HicB family nuclease